MKFTFQILLVLIALSLPIAAAETDEAMERFERGNFDVPTLIEILPRLADPAKKGKIRSKLIEAKKQPLLEMVSLLSHPMLAVRLGALELLEELASGDFAYNPWTSADSPENAASLVRWNEWAKNPIKSNSQGIFSAEQRRGYLQDLLAEDADKASRARKMLEIEGLSAIGFLENFLGENPNLTPGHRARIREAQYQITLSRQLGDQAAVTARQLAFGSRDQMLSSLATAREAGFLSLPILRDFISHPDPLVRECAIDSLLLTGGKPAVEIIAPLLKQESDVNVIHGALRRLKDVKGKTTADLVASFLTHADEDLLISAINTSLSLSGDNEQTYGEKPAVPPSPADGPILAALSDKRWRVRAAALEYVAKRRVSAAKATCLSMLDDTDDFVRYAAIKAVSALEVKEALPQLKALLLKDENMAGPVIEGYGALKQRLDDEMLDRLDAASPEIQLAALRASKLYEKFFSLDLRYAKNENLDVACAALREIAGSEELTKDDLYASVLVEALRSGNSAKVEAVMDRLLIEKSKAGDAKIIEALNGGTNNESTPIDQVYDAFNQAAGKLETGDPKAPALPKARENLIRELLLRTSAETPATMRFRAALNLARASYPQGFDSLLRDLPHLTTAQKIALAEGMSEPSANEAIPLFNELLRDPVPEIRKAAAEAAFSSEDAPAFASLVLTELSRTGAVLLPQEIYGYSLESVLRSDRQKKTVSTWALQVLEAATSSVPLRILAIISLRKNASREALTALEKYKLSPDPLLRRAAWHAITSARPAEIKTAAKVIMTDPDALVRVVLPNSLNFKNKLWNHHFTNLGAISDSYWDFNIKEQRLTGELKQQLGRLATKDPSPLVRFEAAFVLLTHGITTDINALAKLIPQLGDEVAARRRVGKWLSDNANRATPGLQPLLAVADPGAIGPDEMQTLSERINPNQDEGITTFASLAKVGASENTKDQDVLAPAPVASAPAKRESLKIIYFYKPGCPECVRTKDYLQSLEEDFPLLKLEEHNILEASSTLLNQALCQRFSVPSAKHTLSPSIFSQSGFLIRDDISMQALSDLFAKTLAVDQDDSWMKINKVETTAAEQAVDQRYAAFTLPLVIGAGLLDGINPCAFATMIFFLSYLQIARRTPREMLMVGAAFISAVFIAYLAAGLVLYQSLAALNERFSGIQKWMNLGFAALALLAAALSFRDAWRARSGRLDEMTLQLPGFLKDRIRGVIRTGSRARNFVIAAFVSGILISLLELACTGQVYAPIIYQIQQGKLDAVWWLVIYNLAFITPLIVIFLLAYGGLRSETLVAFQKKHTAAVKVGLGLVFVALAVVIFVSQKWLGAG